MKLANPELQSRLAAEYVLGTMKGGARRRFVEYSRDNRQLQAEIAKWEAHFAPLTDYIAAISPPTRVWQQIEARTINNKTRLSTGDLSQNSPKTPANNGLLSNLTFWRYLGLGSSAIAAALVVSVMTGQLAPSREPMLTAVLDAKGVARMVVEQPKPDLITVKMVKPWKTAEEHSLQLWVLGADGKPRSIGLINQDGTTKIAMRDMQSLLADGAMFALSKEARGGSTTGLPSEMILCKGVIAKMPTKQSAKPQGPV
jgi:anti-sigma-K factor RskA